jgi:acetyl-CoA carboxylase biotin carboxylase subunit
MAKPSSSARSSYASAPTRRLEMAMKLARVLVANRGEIAVRIIRACQAIGIETVVAISEADRGSLAARIADRAFCVGPASARESYLDPKKMVGAAIVTKCDCLHPGYGFLAESPELAKLCAENDIIFVGPSPDHMLQMGNKILSRNIAEDCGVPTLPGSKPVSDTDEAVSVAKEIGLPVMIKAASGGGGRGMKIVDDIDALGTQIKMAASEAGAAFGDSTVYLEKYIGNARHIEVQVLGDSHGNIVHLGERDCSLQRRHQKMVEEAPAPGISEDLRDRIRDAAVTLARSVNYESAGTVEFIFDADSGEFYFLEMNTRIQVEHPVTEMITGEDLIEEQFRIAAGDQLRFSQAEVSFRGHAIECRINAERPEAGFMPSPGKITDWRPPVAPYIRLESHCFQNYSVPINYDSMIAKLVVYGRDRPQAIQRMKTALSQFAIGGIETTVDFQHRLISSSKFADGRMNTRLVDEIVGQSQKGAA